LPAIDHLQAVRTGKTPGERPLMSPDPTVLQIIDTPTETMKPSACGRLVADQKADRSG